MRKKKFRYNVSAKERYADRFFRRENVFPALQGKIVRLFEKEEMRAGKEILKFTQVCNYVWENPFNFVFKRKINRLS